MELYHKLEGMAPYGRLLLAPAEGWWPLKTFACVSLRYRWWVTKSKKVKTKFKKSLKSKKMGLNKSVQGVGGVPVGGYRGGGGPYKNRVIFYILYIFFLPPFFYRGPPLYPPTADPLPLAQIFFFFF